MTRLICWWRGHQIKATIDTCGPKFAYVFHCERCRRLLPGPRS